VAWTWIPPAGRTRHETVVRLLTCSSRAIIKRVGDSRFSGAGAERRRGSSGCLLPTKSGLLPTKSGLLPTKSGLLPTKSGQLLIAGGIARSGVYVQVVCERAVVAGG
jgi:hypothetical protein